MTPTERAAPVREALHCECGKERHHREAEAALGALVAHMDELEGRIRYRDTQVAGLRCATCSCPEQCGATIAPLCRLREDTAEARVDELERDRDSLSRLYDERQGQASRFASEARAAEQQAERALAEVRRLKKALLFYANEDDYLWHGEKRGTIQKDDRGAVARAALDPLSYGEM